MGFFFCPPKIGIQVYCLVLFSSQICTLAEENRASIFHAHLSIWLAIDE